MKTIKEIRKDIKDKWMDDSGFITLNPAAWKTDSFLEKYDCTILCCNLFEDLGHSFKTPMVDANMAEYRPEFAQGTGQLIAFKMLFGVPEELSTTISRITWWYYIKHKAKKSWFWYPIKLMTYNRLKKIYGDNPLKAMYKRILMHRNHPFHDLLEL